MGSNEVKTVPSYMGETTIDSIPNFKLKSVLVTDLSFSSMILSTMIMKTYRDFLKRSEDYGLCKSNSSDAEENISSDFLTIQVIQRNQKIEKYRQKKELEDQIKQLTIVMKQENVDDDSRRDYYINLLKLSIIEAQEELSSIEQEKKILEFHRNHPEKSESEKSSASNLRRPFKPIIITRDLAQKAVYGLGYPSFPTMTVSEFYDQRVREGISISLENNEMISKNDKI